MKKFAAILGAALLGAALALSASAEDVAVGEVYSTSILATVDGHVIPSYNIGGRTCVCIEDLQYYGFDVIWDPANAVISANSSDIAPDYSVFANVERGVGGSVTAHIYETNIRAEVNGIAVDSYNIGGYTCVCIEDLGDMTGSPNADYGYSKYLMRAEWDPENAVIALSTFRATPESQNPILLAGLDYGCLYYTGDPYGTVRMGTGLYRDFRGAIDSIIPLYLETSAGMTDIVIAYASPFGVRFDENAVAAVLADESYSVPSPEEAAVEASMEDYFEELRYIDAEDSVVLYGRYAYSPSDVMYSLRIFLADGRAIELLEDLPGIDAAEREFPVESLSVDAGKTTLFFSLIYNGRLYKYEVDLQNGELDMR